MVDALGGLEASAIPGKDGGEVGKFVFMLGELGVEGTEERIGVGDQETAAGAVDEEMLTTRWVVGGIGVSLFLGHFDPR
jgi:hypothetical protein